MRYLDEGPFGEFCGYTTQQVPNERIMTIKAMTHRKDPVYHNIWLGKPPHEHLYVDALTYAVAAFLELKPAYPVLKKAVCPAVGGVHRFDSPTGESPEKTRNCL